VAYAKINPDFRHTVEDLVPGSQSALNILLGPSRSGLLALLLLLLIVDLAVKHICIILDEI